jgi:hypothetical protein
MKLQSGLDEIMTDSEVTLTPGASVHTSQSIMQKNDKTPAF